MNYTEFTSVMRAYNRTRPSRPISGRIIFTQDSFTKEYPLEARTYGVSNDNKAYIDGMIGYSIYGGSLDGSDPCVRLEAYMAEEHGGENGWKVEDCYFEYNEKRIYDYAEMLKILDIKKEE